MAQPNPKLTPEAGHAAAGTKSGLCWQGRRNGCRDGNNQGQPQDVSWGLAVRRSTASWPSCLWGPQADTTHRPWSG